MTPPSGTQKRLTLRIFGTNRLNKPLFEGGNLMNILFVGLGGAIGAVLRLKKSIPLFENGCVRRFYDLLHIFP